MNCPACGYYNPTGATQCFHCALALPVAAAGDATCAAHPDVKATGACSRCGTFGCGACLQQRGEAWLCPACVARAGVLPWDERERLGLWRAWWRTAVQMLSAPQQTLSDANPDAPLGSSLLFAFLSSVVGFAPTMLLYAVAMVPMVLLGTTSKDNGAVAALMPLLFVVYLVVLLAMQVGGVLVLGGVEHLLLGLFGGRPRAYSVSVRAHALAMGVYVIGLFPLCSFYVFPLWSLVLRIIGLMTLHKTTAGKATAAVLAPFVGLCGLGLAFYAALFAIFSGPK